MDGPARKETQTALEMLCKKFKCTPDELADILKDEKRRRYACIVLRRTFFTPSYIKGTTLASVPHFITSESARDLPLNRFTDVSVERYLQNKGVTLQHPNLPCVQSGGGGWKYRYQFPLELLEVAMNDRCL